MNFKLKLLTIFSRTKIEITILHANFWIMEYNTEMSS